MDANDAQQAAQRAADRRFGRGVVEEVTLPPTDPERESKRRDIDDPADVDVDPQELRDGGPVRSPGSVTTTGGTAGPGGVRRLPRHGAKVAPTTTGDATTGGMNAGAGGSTSDAMDGRNSSGKFPRKT